MLSRAGIAHLIDEYPMTSDGYSPLIDFGEWRVAVLRFCDGVAPGNIRSMQRHDETDEVFVLLAGKCILFAFESGAPDGSVESMRALEMNPMKAYNVRRSVWHTHVLSPDAAVLIVENRTTSEVNSPQCALGPDLTAEIERTVKEAWRTGP
ncbi:MAG: hypothetical protein VB144_07255 [Clostridia bacterium]|nr:hypothetical protein [Clostridia bacterium]